MVVFTVFSCGSTKVSTRTGELSTQYVEMGVVGRIQSNLMNTKFETIAIPTLKNKIRVQVTSAPFSKSDYKSYRNALLGQNFVEAIKPKDSLASKPYFLNITLLDKMGFVNELNDASNGSIINSIKNIEDIGVITAISVVFDKENQILLQAAEEVYLVNKNPKKNTLEIYNNNLLTSTINISKATVFAYELSTFCWERTKKSEIIIANLSGKKSKCERGTKSNPKKLIEKENYFKF